MKPPFVIFGLPRSRTFWLSRFLSYGDWNCGHDELRHARSMEDIKAWFSQPNTGTIETLGAPWWRTLPENVSVVVIRRPVADVMNSLHRLGLAFDWSALGIGMTRMDRKLDQIEKRVNGVRSFQFDDLMREEICADLFRHCLPYQHDTVWWEALNALNLQTSMPHTIRYIEAYLPQLTRLAQTAKQQTIASLGHAFVPPDGVTLQLEPFDTFLADGRALFEAHLVQVGEAPDAWREKNIELMRTLEGLGFLQIMTARSNGRMFGYLMAVIGPSLESPTVTSAMHMTFYAAKEFPGLGMKLQRASVEALREKGVNELFLRAGTRGSGPKLASLYRRMGAEDFGQLFKLELKEAA